MYATSWDTLSEPALRLSYEHRKLRLVVIEDVNRLRSLFRFRQILEVGQHGKPVQFSMDATTLFEALTNFNSNIESGMLPLIVVEVTQA